MNLYYKPTKEQCTELLSTTLGEVEPQNENKITTSGRGTEEDVNYGPGQKRDISLRLSS